VGIDFGCLLILNRFRTFSTLCQVDARARLDIIYRNVRVKILEMYVSLNHCFTFSVRAVRLTHGQGLTRTTVRFSRLAVPWQFNAWARTVGGRLPCFFLIMTVIIHALICFAFGVVFIGFNFTISADTL
jgi:hypothetical protein